MPKGQGEDAYEPIKETDTASFSVSEALMVITWFLTVVTRLTICEVPLEVGRGLFRPPPPENAHEDLAQPTE